MSRATRTRELAYEALLAIERDGRQSHLVISEALEQLQNVPQKSSRETGHDDGLEEKNREIRAEKAFLSRLIKGTTEMRLRLDYMLDQFSATPTAKMKPQIRTILRMAVYQICFLDAVPDRAAVSEAVKLAEEIGFGGLKRFVNGVLRTVAREWQTISWPDRAKEPEAYLSVTYSMAPDLVRHWLARFGMQETESICRALLEERPLCVHAIGGEPPFFYLEEGEDLLSREDFREGQIFVQDRSSQLALAAVDIKPGDAVLDLCAAPGGKTMLAAEYCALQRKAGSGEAHPAGPSVEEDHKSRSSGRVLARDISMEKVEKIRENLVRCHVDNVDLAVGDATVFDPALEGRFDVVLADLPCSGYGVAGKKPEIKYKPYEETVLPLADLQKEMLTHAVRYLRPGGRLLFSTCTITKEENEENREWLLGTYGRVEGGSAADQRREKGLVLEQVDITHTLSPYVEADTLREGFLQLLPHQGLWDGFFFSVFRRTEALSTEDPQS